LIVVETALKLVVREVFEVLYSPVKAFRKIIEKPDFKGVLLVLLLVMVSSVAVQYVASSKQLLENRTPENDDWTEALTNQHVWTSNGVLSLDITDYQMGNSSISSSAPEATSIWLKVTGINSINCSEGTSYTELFFWINWTNEVGSFPSSGTLRLFSGSEESYFEKDLTSFLVPSREWTNTTLNVGPDQGWSSNNSPDWQNITGIRFNLVWSDSANLTMNIDGLLFRNFASSIEQGTFYMGLISIILQVGMNWVIWAGLLIIVGKLFNEDLGRWNVFFIIIGYVFMVTVVTNIITVMLVSPLPNLNYILDSTSGLYYPRNSELWLSSLTFQLLTPLIWIGYAWTTALGTIVIRLMKNITWGKALTISVIAFAVRFVLTLFGF
jgi:hypothetical protein